MTRDLPEGFAPHFRKSNLTDPWEPIFSRRLPEAVYIGLWTEARHANSRGFVHGGLISALADNAMGLSCGAAREPAADGLVTVSLSVDFVGSVALGQWLEVRPSVVKAGKRLSFCGALVYADGKVCARANAVFQAVER